MAGLRVHDNGLQRLGPYKLDKKRLITVIDPETGEERGTRLAEAVKACSRRGYIVLDT